ncbi:MAG TPA: polysaccharide biosynthesis tyrosine autokinase [Mucilaginibacter sp.]|nr:polysaccharide biosynthesis tyrosine autokinase [Mucilaginibacter sp.]
MFSKTLKQKRYLSFDFAIDRTMCAQLSDLFPLITEKKKDGSPTFREGLNPYFYHWPLFVLFMLIAVSGAFIYTKISSSTVYEIKATLLVKDRTKTQDNKSTLDELDVMDPPKLAESELEILKSRNIIDHVVSDLQLWVTYQKKDGLGKTDLYKRSPILFRLLDSTGTLQGHRFVIKIKDLKSFYLKKSDGTLRQFSFNDVFINDWGKWKLQPTNYLEADTGSEITISLSDPNKVARKYQKDLDAVLLNKLAPAIGLTLQDNVQQRGKDIINDVIANYKAYSITERNLNARNTLDFIDKRIGSIADELNHSESDLEKYRSSKSLTDISSQTKAYLDNVRDNGAKLNEVNVQLNVMDGIERNINSSQNMLNVSASLGQRYPALNTLIENLSKLQLQRDKILATTPERNPIFEPIDRQIRSTKNDIRESIENIKTSLLDARSKLENINSDVESSIKDLPGQERELLDKTRQKTIKETLYTYLLKKKEEISMSYASTLTNAQVVDYAYVATITSQKPMIFAVAFIFGLVLPAGLISVRNKLNNRVITAKEIEDNTSLHILGELSYVKSSSPLVILDKNNVALNEEFRTLRTNLNILVNNKPGSLVVLVTSSISNEGKSFVSGNLGHILAAAGKKTIVLEFDLRRPKIAGMFGVDAQVGLTEYLNGTVPVKKIIQKSGVNPNLDIIGCGQIPEYPAELLALDKVDELFIWLRENYGYIIVDSPPVNLVSDAKALSRLSDVTLYLIRQAFTYKSLLPFIKSLNAEKQFQNMQIVFNGVIKERYGYGYNYDNEYYRAINKDIKRQRGSLKDFFERF